MFEDEEMQVDNPIESDNDFIEGLGLEIPEVEEEAEDTTEAETETEEQEAEEQPVSEKLEDTEIKFLGETKKISDIPKDDLISFIQKGMNQGRVTEKLNAVTQKYNKVEELAKLYNMTDTEVIDALFNNYFESTDDPIEAKTRYESAKKDVEKKMYAKFVESYPTITDKDIPADVWERVKLGEDLNEVYKEHLSGKEKETYTTEVGTLKKQIEELQQKLTTKEQNDSVKKKAVVKKASDSGNTESEDDFLSGLFGS